VRHAMIILGTEGMLHAANGNTELSTQSFLAAGRLTASISQEPLLISQLIDCSDWGVICRRLEWSLNTGTFSEEQLARLQEMFAAAENNSFYCGLVGEQAFGYAVFSDPKSQMALLVPGGPFGLGGPPPSGKDHLRGQLLLGFLKTTGFFKKDRAFYLRAMSNHIASSKLPFPERFTVSQNSSFVPPNGFYLISSMMLPALGKAATRDATRAANLRVTETALAIERYRRSNSNSLPDSLSQLVPAYLPAVPADPFDGKPLRFKKRSEGYVVYSVGSDQQDDGGTERDPKKTNVRSDVTFILEH